jgi:hypothetical protein
MVRAPQHCPSNVQGKEIRTTRASRGLPSKWSPEMRQVSRADNERRDVFEERAIHLGAGFKEQF